MYEGKGAGSKSFDWNTFCFSNHHILAFIQMTTQNETHPVSINMHPNTNTKSPNKPNSFPKQHFNQQQTP